MREEEGAFKAGSLQHPRNGFRGTKPGGPPLWPSSCVTFNVTFRVVGLVREAYMELGLISALVCRFRLTLARVGWVLCFVSNPVISAKYHDKCCDYDSI